MDNILITSYYTLPEYCNPPKFEYGKYKPMQRMYNVGDRMYYTCMDGYSIYYEKEIYEHSKCMEDGNWDYQPPKCKKAESRMYILFYKYNSINTTLFNHSTI